jgi:hypothetical protein
MLSKEVCKRCTAIEVVHGWLISDDRRWFRGYLVCPFSYTDVLINDDPPERCPYRLEHIVENHS